MEGIGEEPVSVRECAETVKETPVNCILLPGTADEETLVCFGEVMGLQAEELAAVEKRYPAIPFPGILQNLPGGPQTDLTARHALVSYGAVLFVTEFLKEQTRGDRKKEMAVVLLLLAALEFTGVSFTVSAHSLTDTGSSPIPSIHSYASVRGDGRIRLLRQPENGGAALARNRGLKVRYLARFSSSPYAI